MSCGADRLEPDSCTQHSQTTSTTPTSTNRLGVIRQTTKFRTISPAPAAPSAPASGAGAGSGSLPGNTLFERMANLSRGASTSEEEDEDDDADSGNGGGLNIPRFLGRQNNQ